MKNTLKQQALQGKPLTEEQVIDCHAHIGYWQNFFIPWNDARGMIEVMDTTGIDLACVSGHAAIGPDFRRGNDLVAETIERYPDRFRGYVTVHPCYRDGLLPELKRCFNVEGFVGIKLHPSLHNYQVSEDICIPIWEYADERNLVVISHTWESAEVLADLAERYPDIHFLVAHSTTLCSNGDTGYIKLARESENVYLDITSSTVDYGLIEYMVREAGEDRIILGTDIPFLEAAVQLGNVLWADLCDSIKRKILGGTFLKLIGNP